MTSGNNSQRHIKRAGLVTTLGITAMLILTACGGTPPAATPAAQPTSTLANTSAATPAGTEIATALDTAVATAPAAVSTETSDMGDMAETAGGTPTTATNDSNAASTATPATSQDNSAGATTQINATLREWALDLDQKEVPAGKVVINVTNAGQMNHNLTVEDSSGVIGKTPNFGSQDGVQTLELELAPGTYSVICSLPGHATRGQQNTLVVK